MELSDFGAAVGDFSQMLASAILLPFRRRGEARGSRRGLPVPPARGAPRGLPVRVRGHLVLTAGTVPDEVLVELVHLAGGRAARAVVLPAASYDFASAGERYRRYLQRFGMAHTETADVSTRSRAEDTVTATRLAAADLLVLGGGSPDLILAVMAGTAVESALQAALARGAVVALFGPASEAAGEWCLPPVEGAETRAGAAATPAGADRAPHATPASALLRQGLGLLPGTFVAAAPVVGGRIAQVFAAALTSGVQALVLDERSALAVRPGWRGEVLAGTVLAVGGHDARALDAPAPLGGAFTRVAPVGWHLDLAARLVLPPGEVADARSAMGTPTPLGG